MEHNHVTRWSYVHETFVEIFFSCVGGLLENTKRMVVGNNTEAGYMLHAILHIG